MVRSILGLLVLFTAFPVSAADPPAAPVGDFAGHYQFRFGEKQETRTVVVREAKAWEAWKGDRLPKFVAGNVKRLDTPNDDPLLTAEIDWTKSAVVVVAAGGFPRNVKIGRVTTKDGVTTVEYEFEDTGESRPVDWGAYAARVIPRPPGKVEFREVKRAKRDS